MSDQRPLPLNGRVVGLALAIIGLALALRTAWTVLQPVVPTLLYLAAAIVAYRFLIRGRRK